ncbi:hypothetical protein [Streptomyces capparidis]
MPESRRSLPGAGVLLRKAVPPPAVCGFLLLLAALFAVSYAVGAAAGPVAPGMHGTGTGGGGDGGEDGRGGGAGHGHGGG